VKIFLVIVLVLIALAVVAVVTAGRSNYEEFLADAARIRKDVPTQPAVPVTDKDLEGLPEPVKNWMKAAGVLGKNRVTGAHLKHAGQFRPSPDGGWSNITGEYFLTTGKPSFAWFGSMNYLPLVPVVARDSYFDGKGRMLIKLLGTFTMLDATGSEIDVSAQGRLLAEFVMLPHALLPGPGITWEPLTATSAKVTLDDGGMKARAVFHFGKDALPERAVVERYYSAKGGSVKATFLGTCLDYKDFQGFRIPSRMEGTWDLPEGPYKYVDFLITEASFE
jgi:hypothetical protein